MLAEIFDGSDAAAAFYSAHASLARFGCAAAAFSAEAWQWTFAAVVTPLFALASAASAMVQAAPLSTFFLAAGAAVAAAAYGSSYDSRGSETKTLRALAVRGPSAFPSSLTPDPAELLLLEETHSAA